MKVLYLRAAMHIAIVALAVGATIAARGAIIFTGSDPSDALAASATFTYLSASNDLQVTLVNTYTGDTTNQSHVLTGVFFDGASGLTTVSATAGATSVQWSGSSSSAPSSPAVLGTEWAYFYGDNQDKPDGATNGIISSGYSLGHAPGSGNFASPGDMLDGSAYGILSEGYAGSDEDGLSTRVYIQDTMVFVLGGFNGNLSDISDVTFQYGTTLGSEPSMSGSLVVVPEPSVLACLSVGALLFSRAALRRQR